jgi:hypothetical protein
MESLKEGVKLYDPISKSDRPRFLICDGVIEASGNAYGFHYEENAVVPKKPWRRPNPKEEKLMFLSDGNANRLENLAITKLPDPIIDRIRKLNISEAEDEKDILEIKKAHPKEYIDVMDGIYDYKCKFLVDGPFSHKIGVIVNGSNRETVTVKDNKYILGLHIDNWDLLKKETLHHASNRICVNLGKQDRHFLLVNQTISTIHDWVASNIDLHETKSTFWMHDVVTKFFKLFPGYPVVKVRVSPYEAYIAPTENIIHDGCTDGNTAMDIDITTRGKFGLTPKVA